MTVLAILNVVTPVTLADRLHAFVTLVPNLVILQDTPIFPAEEFDMILPLFSIFARLAVQSLPDDKSFYMF